MVTPRFELHILPLFRALDREHMLSRFDVSSYNDVVQNADALLGRLSSDMPPPSSGGPWPGEWVDLFRRWKETGFKRLELGTAATLSLSRVGSKFVILAEGHYPAAGYRGWLHLLDGGRSEREYVLYFDAPDTPKAGTAQQFSIRERYATSDMRRVVVRDAVGEHILVETTAPAALHGTEALSDLQFFKRGE